MKKDFTVSLVIPCYNESINLNKNYLFDVFKYIQDRKEFIEVLIIDDDSTDDSRSIIKSKYLNKFTKLQLIENEHGGKAFGVMTGIQKAKGEFVMFSDMDFATPITEADKLFKSVHQGFDVVIGSRAQSRKGAPLTRKIQAKGFYILRSFIIGLSGISDTQCGFKIFNKKAAISVINNMKVFTLNRKISGPAVTAGFDLELLFLLKKFHYKIDEVSVLWHHAETKRVSFFKDSIEGVLDIFKIKFFDIVGKYYVAKN